MAKTLKFIFAPLIGLGFVWFVIKSAFVTGQGFAQQYLLKIFGDDDV